MKKQNIILILTLILLAGAFLRFYNIGEESFWLDETATALTLKKYSTTEILSNTVTKGDILPEYYVGNLDLPTYFVILKLWSKLFGLNEASLRTLSAIFGTLSILLIYFLASELFDKKAGIISSLVFSLHIVMIEYSQEARLYMMLTFLVLISGYFFIKSIKTNRWPYAILFIISNLIGIYTHYPFLFFVMVEGVYLAYIAWLDYLKDKKFRIDKSKIAFIITLFGYLFHIKFLSHPKFAAIYYTGKLSIFKLGNIFLQMNTWIYPSIHLREKLANIQFLKFGIYDILIVLSALLITLILFAYFMFGLFKLDYKKSKFHVFPLIWIFVTLGVSFIILYRSIVTFASIRHFLFIVPAYIMVSAFGMSKMKKNNLAMLLAIFLLLSIFPIIAFYSNLSNAQYREAALYLEQNANKQDTILVNLPSVKVALDYYSDKLENIYRISNASEAEKYSGRDSIWLVLSTKYADPDGSIKNYFDKNYKLVKSEEFFDVKIYHYTKK